jgi:hypothetical protein
MDKPRANTATAHKLARLVYFMLTRGEEFVDQGQQRYEEEQCPSGKPARIELIDLAAQAARTDLVGICCFPSCVPTPAQVACGSCNQH